MGNVIDFNSRKDKIIKKYKICESKLNKNLMYLSLYLKKEILNLVGNETNRFIDELLIYLKKADVDDNNEVNLLLKIDNIERIRYEYFREVDLLLSINELKHVSLNTLKEYFGESFEISLDEKLNESYIESTDDEYWVVEYRLAIRATKKKIDSFYRNRFMMQKYLKK